MTSTTTFEQLGIIDPIIQVCTEEKFNYPTEIQEKSIPHVIAGKDVIGEAATGSGKTLAFASGIIQHTKKGEGIQALVITPTRELAQQVAEMINDLSKYKPLQITTVYGGVSINPQIKNLKIADVVVGTPGRLIDHINRGTIHLNRIKTLVLDECDRLLDMGFLPDVEKIIKKTPENRQTLLFSATISYEVNQIAQKYMEQPIDVEGESYVDPDKLRQYYYGPMHPSLKFSLLIHLLNQQKENNLSMIFCNTRRQVDFIIRNLNNSGIRAAALHGGYSQQKRTDQLERFNSQKIRILVATDVAARGLDISGVTHIYNYDLPNNRKQYIHRIGRTARAGKAGKAITLVTNNESEKFFNLFRYKRFNITKNQIPYVKKVPIIKSRFHTNRKQSRSPSYVKQNNGPKQSRSPSYVKQNNGPKQSRYSF